MERCNTCSDNGAAASMLWDATFPAMVLASVSRIILQKQIYKILDKVGNLNKASV